MKLDSPLKKFGIPAVIVLAIILIVYFIMGKSGTSNSQDQSLSSSGLSSTVTNTPVNPLQAGESTNNQVGSTILDLLKNVDSITLPVDILSSNAFASLSDGTVILPKRNDPGRRNPFSTLSGSGTATSINPSVGPDLLKNTPAPTVTDGQSGSTNIQTKTQNTSDTPSVGTNSQTQSTSSTTTTFTSPKTTTKK